MRKPTPNAGANATMSTEPHGRTRDDAHVRLPKVIRGVSFWIAILLPLFYLPLLYAEPTSQTVLAFLGLLVMNVIALLTGHDYYRD